MDDQIAQFSAITSATPEQATQYLRLADNDLEQAIELFFTSSGDLDLGGNTAPAQTSSAPRSAPRDEDIIDLDSDDEMTDAASRPSRNNPSIEDDAAMARRLQEEMYGGGGPNAAEEVRAPIARTTETLLGPGSRWEQDDVDDMVTEQLLARQRRPGRVGIFNQNDPTAGDRAHTSAVWNEDTTSESAAERSRRELARATGGASEASSKSNRLAQMYRPPFDLMCRLPWDQARDQGKKEEKWLLVNVQHAHIFDCQVLNRDIWKDEQIKATVKESFFFMQFDKDDPQGQQYMQYYFPNREVQDNYPHIAIVDPRTGEQVKVWSGPPVPKPVEFLMQLHEFLDRYSLKANARNPVATRKPEKKVDFDRMTEEEQLEWALQNSMGNGEAPNNAAADPDTLTKDPNGEAEGKGKQRADSTGIKAEDNTTTDASDAPTPAPSDSAFALIPAKSEPEPPSGPATTRIQFRHANGRLVRRFNLDAPVVELYQWLKAEPPVEGKEGVEFSLSLMGRDLLAERERTVGEVGLKNASVMVEYLDS